jgi:hypothetical protein
MSKEGARQPKSELAGATTKKRTTKAKATAAGQAKKAMKVKTTAKPARKTATKQAVSAAAKMPVSSPDLKRARGSTRREVAMGATPSKKKAATTPSGPEVDLRDQIGAGRPSEEIEVLIRFRAYELWEQKGREHGRALEDWLEAEQELADALSKAAGTRSRKTGRVARRTNAK